MKNSIGKPYERKVHVRFDEGGADSLLLIIIFIGINKVDYQALLYAEIIKNRHRQEQYGKKCKSSIRRI